MTTTLTDSQLQAILGLRVSDYPIYSIPAIVAELIERRAGNLLAALAPPAPAVTLTREQMAKIIHDQLSSMDIGCGPDVNIYDALAAFRKEDELVFSIELTGDFAAYAADAILAAQRGVTT